MDVSTPYGPLLVHQQANVETMRKGELQQAKVDIHFIDPSAIFWHACTTSEPFSQLVSTLRTPSASHPWEILLYSDEISPGNVLRHANQRKLVACYWSIKELGALNLSCERLWFVVGLCRSETVRSLTGKMGAFTKMCLQLLQKLQFGVEVKLAATQKNIMAFGKLQILLGDEAALKDMVDFRGAAATLPCPFCRNLVDVRSNLQDHSTGAKLVPSTCLDWSLIEAHSDESIMALYEFLGKKKDTCSQTAFNKVQQLCGFTWNERGILNDPNLEIRVVSMVMWDWLHVYLVNGLWHTEVTLLLNSLSGSGVTQVSLHAELESFVWPRSASSRGATGKNIFAKKQVGDVRCAASEALSLYPCFRLILQEKLQAGQLSSFEAPVTSYLRLARVLDLLQGIKSGRTTSHALESAVIDHLKAFQRSYGTERWQPKHHFSLHLGGLLARHSALVPCFALERKHKELKRWGNTIANTWQSFERSIIRDSLTLQLQELEKPLKAGILDPGFAGQAVQDLLQVNGNTVVGREALYAPGATCSMGDLVLCDVGDAISTDGSNVCEVMFHVESGGTYFSCVSFLKPLGQNKFRKGGITALLETSAILDVCTYKKISERELIIAPSTLW